LKQKAEAKLLASQSEHDLKVKLIHAQIKAAINGLIPSTPAYSAYHHAPYLNSLTSHDSGFNSWATSTSSNDKYGETATYQNL